MVWRGQALDKADGIKPLYDAMKQKLIKIDHIFADEVLLLALHVCASTATSKALEADQTVSE